MNTLTAAALITAVTTLSVTPAALAQTDRSTAPKQPPASERMERSTMSKSDRATWRGQDGVVEAGKITGTKVRNSAGKDLGEVDSLLVDSKSGKVTHAVIGLGGLAGIGETKVVVPWASLTMAHDPNNRDKMIVTMEQSAVDAAPKYDRREAATDRAPAASPRAPR